MFFAALAPARAEVKVEVVVQGIEGRLLDNVMARLRIYLLSRNSDLNAAELRRLHRLAATDIKSALIPFGYYDARVSGSLTAVDSGWRAAYQVEPGEPVILVKRSVSVIGEGSGLPELQNPEELIPLDVGDELVQQSYEEGKKQLLRRARSIGFLDASYPVHAIRIDRLKKAAEIDLVLDTGPRYRFGTISSDQQVISGDLLKRFLTFETGDYYYPRYLQELQRDLYRADFFSSVVVSADTNNPEGLDIPVTIAVEPLEHYNRYGFGVGYASDTWAYIRLEWFNRLLNQYGHRGSSSLLVGQQQSHCMFSYFIPVADPRYNTISANARWNREQWEGIVTNSLSGGLNYEFSTREHQFGLSLVALNEDYRVGDTKGSSGLIMPGIHGSWAIANDIVATENGLRASVEITGASQNLASDATFLKARADGTLILSPLKGWRLIGRGSIGAILVDSIDDIPPSLRFFAGGEKSVRGYRYRTLGPEDDSQTVVGGKYLLTGSIEIERSFSEYWRGAVFYDVGNALEDPTIDLAHGVGFGVGLALPFGQARLDLAYPINDEGTAQYVFFRVGTDL